MKTIIITMLGAVALLCGPGSVPGWAQDGTNFPALRDYPASTCAKPAALPRQPVTTVAAEIERYNVLVANYNKAGNAYVACVNAYVGNANRDMDTIRQKIRAATDEANKPQ